MTAWIARIRAYFLRELWISEPPPGVRGWSRYIARTGVMVVEGCWNQEILVRSAALTFKVAFSIVPLLAVILALFKGFGGFKVYADRVRDFLLSHLAAGLGDKVSTNLNEIVDRLDAAAIGLVGFAILLYSAISLLSSIEAAFNVIWGVRRQRSIVRQVTVYWTLLTIGPICLAVILGGVAFVQSQDLYLWLTGNVPYLGALLVVILPVAMVWIAFGLMYVVMPNTKVPFKAALIGALVSGTAWHILFRLYVAFNKDVLARYAVYGSLSVIPVFLLWIYVSWIIILFGAEVAFAAQHVRTYKREVEALRLSAAFKERLALHVMIEFARDFSQGRDPATSEAVAQRLKIPVRACNEAVFNLTRVRLLRELSQGQTASYVPAEDLDRITVKRVVDALRHEGDEPAFENRHPRLETLLNEAVALTAAPLERVTLRQLVQGDFR